MRGSRPGQCASQEAVCDGKIGEEGGCEDNSDEICDTSRCSGGELTLATRSYYIVIIDKVVIIDRVTDADQCWWWGESRC